MNVLYLLCINGKKGDMSKDLGYILWLTKKIQKEGEYKTNKSKRFIFILKEAHDNGLYIYEL